MNTIKHQLTILYNPQRNDKAERYNRTIMEKVRAIIEEVGCSQLLWTEAVNPAVYLINRSSTEKIPESFHEEKWSEMKPHLEYLKVFVL